MIDKNKLKRHLDSPLIKCACGCGEEFHSISKYGDRLKYVKGHQNKVQKGHNHKGGIIKTDDGRIKLLVPDHPYRNNTGYVYRYRLNLEKHLGRYLEKDEVVHHKNGIKDDDRIENLEILSSSKHTIIHNITDMSNRKCSGFNCLHPNKTKIEKNGTPHWYKNPIKEGLWLCDYCADKLRE